MMLVTGNGFTMNYNDDDADGLWSQVFDILNYMAEETLEDTIAEHALDTICFLQDATLYTPMDDIVVTPWSWTAIYIDLSD